MYFESHAQTRLTYVLLRLGQYSLKIAPAAKQETETHTMMTFDVKQDSSSEVQPKTVQDDAS